MKEEKNVDKKEIMKSDCPVCGTKGSLEVINKTDNIPYFGDILETSVHCNNCGYFSSDNIALEHNDPVRYKLKIDNTKMNSRVARSQSSTVSLPELGLKVEPGPKSQGYVSNVEGILERFEQAVLKAITLEGENIDSEIEKNALQIIEQITNLKSGEFSTYLIVEDPFGNSVIDDEDAIIEYLTQEEIDGLRTGFSTIEND